MSPENFVYWLQGLFELSDVKTLNEKQVQIIKDHLNYVFIHSVPQTPLEEQKSATVEVQVTGSGQTEVKKVIPSQPLTEEAIRKAIEESRKQWPDIKDRKWFEGAITGTGIPTAVVC